MTAIYIGSTDAKSMYQEFLLSDPTHIDANVDYYIEWLVNRITDLRADVEDKKIIINRRDKVVVALIDRQRVDARIIVQLEKQIEQLERKDCPYCGKTVKHDYYPSYEELIYEEEE